MSQRRFHDAVEFRPTVNGGAGRLLGDDVALFVEDQYDRNLAGAARGEQADGVGG